VEAALAAPQQQLADCRADFAALLAYFGENAAAAQRDTEFWQDTLVAFVRALSAAQHAATRQQQVVAVQHCRSPRDLPVLLPADGGARSASDSACTALVSLLRLRSVGGLSES
jgi:hypothetical protein